MRKYYLEFILSAQDILESKIKNSLMEFGDNLKIFQPLQDIEGKKDNLRIEIETQDPTLIFDICSQFGKIKSVKVNEI